MLITSEFKIDLFQLKHTRDATALLDSLKVEAAQALGLEMVKKFPYERISAYEGELPEMSLNKDHEFVDRYAVELVVLTTTQWQELVEMIAMSWPTDYKTLQEKFLL